MENDSRAQSSSNPVAHWDQLYRSTVLQLPWEVDETPEELSGWAGRLTQGARVLDLGCGRGQHAVAMAKRWFEVWGIDFSSAAIHAARTLAKLSGLSNVRFEVADILTYRTERAFDLVYDYSVFHHIHRADYRAYADTVTKAVRAGGLFALVCYSNDDPAVTIDGESRRVGSLGNVITHPQAHEVLNLFSAGFRLQDHEQTRLGPMRQHQAHHFIFQRLDTGTLITHFPDSPGDSTTTS